MLRLFELTQGEEGKSGGLGWGFGYGGRVGG